MRGKVLFQNIEELHEPGGDELSVGEVGGKGHLGRQITEKRVVRVRLRIVSAGGSVADAEESRGQGIQLMDVKLIKVAVSVNEHVALQRLLGGDVVPDAVVGEVVKDLHGEEEAGRGDVAVPLENGLVDDLDFI